MNEAREQELIRAGKEAEQTGDVESLKRKYSGTDEEFSYLFRKPKPASYDRYVKTISNSVTKASKSFVFDNIIEEQRDELKKTVEEYPAITISLADKLLRMLGLADTTSVKKL